MKLTDLTFVDIESIPIEENCPSDIFPLFYKKFTKEIEENGATWDLKASLHAEFGKIVCISIGKMVEPDGKFYIRTIAGRNEKELLIQAAASFAKAGGTLCGHNSLEFDFPFLMRRYMINGLPIPSQLDVDEKKTWEYKLKDTMKMWSGPQWSYKVSLELLAHVLGVPSSKADMNGGDVAKIYYDSFNVGTEELPFDAEQKAMKIIGDYCSKDVLCCAQCYLRMKGLPLIETIEYV